jgi:hypothetical protein
MPAGVGGFRAVSRSTPRTTGKRWSALPEPVAHDAMVAGAPECNQRLLEELGKEEVAALPGPVDRLTDTAAGTLGAEKDLNRPEVRRSEFSRAGPPGLSK